MKYPTQRKIAALKPLEKRHSGKSWKLHLWEINISFCASRLRFNDYKRISS